MMTSAQIRQSFLDFFQEKSHTIVPSASLMPQSPGLLFTNAGMNQFVPYFLGVWKAPYTPPRAADTQKCIRAGGKHNDLEDVGYDTYHHTFFEMLGNWSFGDYFKTEAIEWAWELIVERWHIPANRLYATVYAPDKSKGDPGEFDQEAWDCWAKLFRSKGLNPEIHIVDGNVKDNFWMMGDTGPCGPCSELHVDLTPEGATQGKLVNQSSDQCIEIWNLVFIQYNAESDGSFRELPEKHVDTGMGFERACSLIQSTKNFTDFSSRISNYATDVFAPIFRKLEQLSGKTYVDIYPSSEDKSALSLELKEAIAFRVIADHIRTLSFSIADGILPGNNGRNYVLRRILRRAVRYGRTLGFGGKQPFLPELVDVLVEHFAPIFPEMGTRANAIKEVLLREESSFNETLDRGLELFEAEVARQPKQLSAEFAFKLYDTYGFPMDLTQLLAEERALALDSEGFERLMEEQRERARASRKSIVVRALDISSSVETEFLGYSQDQCEAVIKEVYPQGELLFLVTDKTPFYAEMGGQAGDEGILHYEGHDYPIMGVQQVGSARAHLIAASEGEIPVGASVSLMLNKERRRLIESHHTATHLLHRALRQIVSEDATQQGSLVNEERLRFDFNAAALTPAQIEAVEKQVNEWIGQGAPVFAQEVEYAKIKNNQEITQFFGEKYGNEVRVVQIGGEQGAWDGFSMELCGGTHIDNTGNIGIFKIKSEGAIASGVRRIEASCGAATKAWLKEVSENIREEIVQSRQKLVEANERLEEVGAVIHPLPVLEQQVFQTLKDHENLENINAALKEIKAYAQDLKQLAVEAEKSLKKAQATAALARVDVFLNEALSADSQSLVALLEGGNELIQELLNGLKKRQFMGKAFFVIDDGLALHLAAYAGKEAQAQGVLAGKWLQSLAALGEGKGGGNAEQARGSAPKRAAAEEILHTAKS